MGGRSLRLECLCLALLEAQPPWLSAECLDCSSKAPQGITGHIQNETGQQEVRVRRKSDGTLNRRVCRR